MFEYKNYKDKKWLINKYHNETMSMDEICTLEKINRATLIYWFKKLGVSSRPARKRMYEKYADKDWLYHKYFSEKHSAQQIANLCNCSVTPIYYWLNKFGFETRYKGESKTINISEQTLRLLYVDNRKTISAISKELNCSKSIISRCLKKYGIILRNASSYNVDGCVKKKISKLKGRKKEPFSIEHRINLSKAHTKGKWNGFYDDSIYQRTRNTQEYIDFRLSMFQRDNFICQDCRKKRENALELHHIVPCRDFEKGIMLESNVITLCKYCHSKTFGKEYNFVDKYKSMLRRL